MFAQFGNPPTIAGALWGTFVKGYFVPGGLVLSD